MVKNLRLFYVLSFVLVGVVIAWKSLASSLFGVGVNFVIMLVLLAILLMLFCTNADVKPRVLDLLIVSAVFTFFELIPYLV